MTSLSPIAVVGGTGKAGKYLVRQLIREGFHIRLLHRHPETVVFESDHIEIVKGDARDAEAIHRLLNGCEAVISTLGQPKGEPSIFSTATRHVLGAMHAHHIRRYILITGLNVDTPSDHKSGKTRAGTDWMKANYPETTQDKQVEYGLLTQSDVDWTLVRLPMIELTDYRSEVRVSLEDCPGEKISATDLACFLVEQLKSASYIRQAPFIATDLMSS